MKTYPKIGIRPTIDGRQGGVRESLEEKTMNLAGAVANLINSNLKNSDGSPVECVIADGTIGRVGESAACAEKFEREGVGSTITVTSCWCYGSETMDMNPYYPKAVWGFNGTERPGAVYLAAVLAAHAQKGLPAFGIYGSEIQDIDDNSIPDDVAEKILRFARAAQATATMRGKSYLSIGSVAMGIAGSIVNPDFFQKYLGMRNESVDSTEILRRIKEGIYDPDEFEKAMTWVEKYCKPNEGTDYNRPEKQKSREEKDKDWEFVVKMTIIVKDLLKGNPKLKEMGFKEEAIGHNAILGGFQGQRQWTDFLPNGDFMETILNSSFDWNGIREAILLATENDSLNGVAMLFNHLLTNKAQIFSDVRTYWSPQSVKRVTGKELTGLAANGIIHLINSGATTLDGTGRQNQDGLPAMKEPWNITQEEVEACLAATRWSPADRDYFRGGGFSSTFLSRGGMPVTMSRVNIVDGQGPVLQLAEGWTVDVDPEIFEIINKRTDKTWPTTWFAPRLTGKGAFKDVYSVMNNWGANHGAISYGHIGQDLITLASMLRIPVCMHNVDEDKIFRPAAWNAFGMEKEGADYRACANFGPIYK
ncbi:MAG TPA: L-fucose isomerase [Dysgonamonadaceae bacterium]|nr:L-fucose isomerase [Dysgonamonadaceae bacterium]HOV36704.1 L-fucose isomerase [Dysgonamonadaceae bacterium]HPD43415.1 L-fucose isomerase [Dysgonamonadaceae bacterium]HRS40477.1 L-fucose isomerase [Dysgonamonadaceae bacterium]HRU13017.1 L-fucose isomerase [Dysgonamonadaceae bacterium]